MLSSILEITCKQCGYSEAIGEYFPRSGEYWGMCPICGWSISIDAIIDRVQSTKEETFYKTNKNGKLIYRTTEHKGLGAAWLAPSTESGFKATTIHPFSSPKSDDEVFRIKEKDGGKEFDWDKSYVKVWDEKTNHVRFVIGHMPEAEKGLVDDIDKVTDA